MIHIIPQHIGKGSYVGWYDLIEFEEPHIFHKFDDTEIIEKKIIGEPPYLNKLVEKLNKKIKSKISFHHYHQFAYAY